MKRLTEVHVRLVVGLVVAAAMSVTAAAQWASIR